MNQKIKLILFSLVVIVFTAGLIGYLTINNEETVPPESSLKSVTLYTTTSAYDGGPCGYISFTDAGERTDKCIDEDSANNAAEKLKADNPNLDILNDVEIMKIEADVHEVVESRSPATLVPEPRDKKVIFIDKLHTVSPTDLQDN